MTAVPTFSDSDVDALFAPVELYEFDVMTATHDDLKVGRLARTHSRVLISTEHYTAAEAADLAACIAASVHGGMPTAVLCRY